MPKTAVLISLAILLWVSTAPAEVEGNAGDVTSSSASGSGGTPHAPIATDVQTSPPAQGDGVGVVMPDWVAGPTPETPIAEDYGSGFERPSQIEEGVVTISEVGTDPAPMPPVTADGGGVNGETGPTEVVIVDIPGPGTDFTPMPPVTVDGGSVSGEIGTTVEGIVVIPEGGTDLIPMPPVVVNGSGGSGETGPTEVGIADIPDAGTDLTPMPPVTVGGGASGQAGSGEAVAVGVPDWVPAPTPQPPGAADSTSTIGAAGQTEGLSSVGIPEWTSGSAPQATVPSEYEGTVGHSGAALAGTVGISHEIRDHLSSDTAAQVGWQNTADISGIPEPQSAQFAVGQNLTLLQTAFAGSLGNRPGSIADLGNSQIPAPTSVGEHIQLAPMQWIGNQLAPQTPTE